MRAAELEGEFAELGGWEAESEASQLLQNLNIPEELHYQNMSELANGEKVKVLLAKALFGKPDSSSLGRAYQRFGYPIYYLARRLLD